MKRIVYCLWLLLPVMGWAQDNGYQINVTLKPFKNSYIYLGYYYGNQKALADSALLNDNSQAVFKGAEKLPGGIYFIVSPQKKILLELLLDKDQQFTVQADTANLPDGVKFTGSPDNEHFHGYSLFANQTGTEIARLMEERANEKEAARIKQLDARSKVLRDQLQHYRDSVVEKDPESMLAVLFEGMKDPVVPPAAEQPGGKYDSAFAYRYYKDHYWDGTTFMDDRLVRTPFFEMRLDKYFKNLVSPAPDSINKEVDYMLLYARNAPDLYKFLMVYFVQKYINPEYMGQDAVFVHLFEKYINTGQTIFFTEKYMDYMTKRAYSLMANLLGQPAADLEMVDSTGQSVPLYGVNAPFTVICFWDPTCSHCKDVVPRLDSIYEAKWKAEGVKIYAVMVDGGQDKWKQFIRDNHLNGWMHVYETDEHREAGEKAGQPNYRQLYDVYQTPILYLLDKDKRIVAKKLTYLQLDEVISLKLKNPSSN